MNDRRETIHLQLEDDASTPALRAAAAFRELDASIDSIDGHATTANRRFTSLTQRGERLATSMGKANAALGSTNTTLESMSSRGLVRFNGEIDRGTASIDRYSGRVALLGTALMALGPSILPVSAAAVPALGAIVTGMVAAAAGAATLVLAFQGVGDAVKAVSDYRLEPTADNLAKVKQVLEALGPEGAEFVMALDEMRPALDNLQQLSRAGIFPGFTEGLDDLITRLPQVSGFVEDISTRVGNLGAGTGDSLANDADWREFFAFIDNEAGPAMEEWGRATGNFIAGAANMVEALSEISGGVPGDLVETSQAFREWADNLEHTEGFQEFADYVRASGPQVADFLSSSADAMVALAQAAAPWGSVVLPILSVTADVFTAIAGSPIGPPLFAAAAAMLAFSKASALASTSVARIGTLTAAGGPLGTAATAVRGLRTEMSTMAATVMTSGARSERQLGRFASSAERARGHVRALAGEAGRAGPAVAAMGLLATGTADKMGLTNTAMLTLAGSMAGPWGAAVGAGVGLTMDLATATDDLQAAVKGANAAMDSGGLEEMSASLKTLQDNLRETTDNDVLGFDLGKFDGLGEFSNVIAPMGNLTKLMGGLTGETSKAAAALEKLKGEKESLEDLAVALGANKDSATEMASGADRAQVAMKALGISNQDLAAAQRSGGVEFDLLTGRIRDYVASADSTAGRTDAVGDAIADLGNDAISTADSATQLNTALQALFAPTLNLEAATDQWRASLKTLRDELKDDAGFSSFTEAGRKNNQLTRDYVNDSLERLTALADVSTTTEGDMARAVGKTREEFIKSGMAAGFSRKEIAARADALGLTPELVKTIFTEAGIDEVDLKARGLKKRFDALPPRVQTAIRAEGIPKSEADITRLQKKYGLTPPQVRTLAALKDAASGKIADILARLLGLDGQTATTTVTNRIITERIIRTRNEFTTGRAENGGRSPATNARGGLYANGVRMFADGGWGMDGRYYSREPQIIPGGANILWGEKETGWEAYISGKPSERDRNLEILALAADRLGAAVIPAANGRITAYASGGSRGSGGSRSEKAWERLEKALERHGNKLERSLDKAEKAVDRARGRLDHWNQKRNEVRSDVTNALTLDWFSGGSTNPFSGSPMGGTAAFANQQWKTQGSNSKTLQATIANLRKNGAGDAFIREILGSEDPLAAAQMFNKQTKPGMLHSQKLFLSATKATSAAAAYTSGVVYGDEQAKATKELRGLRGDVRDVKKAINRNHKTSEATRKRHSASKAVSSGKRSQTRSKRG